MGAWYWPNLLNGWHVTGPIYKMGGMLLAQFIKWVHGTGPLYKMGDMVLAQFIKWVAWYWPNL